MDAPAKRPRFTIIELLVVVFVIGMLAALLVPAIQSAREESRRRQCIDNLRAIGLAVHKYLDANKCFPQNGFEVGGDPNTYGSATGWSFLVKILPMMEQAKLYENVPVSSSDVGEVLNREMALGAGIPCPALTLNDSPPDFLFCPSNTHSHFANPGNTQLGTKFGLTNYKGIGATVIGALNAGLRPGRSAVNDSPSDVANGLYGTDWSRFPDGVMFVGPPNQALRREDIIDGLSHTFLCAETIDNTPATVESGGSRWMFASDCTMVGLPTLDANGAAIPDAKGRVYFEGPGSEGYYFPKGHLAPQADGASIPMFGDDNPNPNYRVFRTYLSFKLDGVDVGLYPSYGCGNNWTLNPNRPVYGPSSMHPKFVNHLLCDGAVLSVPRDLYVAAYMFLTTRAGVDPVPFAAGYPGL